MTDTIFEKNEWSCVFIYLFISRITGTETIELISKFGVRMKKELPIKHWCDVEADPGILISGEGWFMLRSA